MSRGRLFLIIIELAYFFSVPDDVPGTQGSGNQVEGLLNYEDEEDDDEENEEEEEETRFEETSFKFMDFLQRFANLRVVSNLAILLKNFEKNTPELNHYVLKMFHRIALDCKMPAMMYQASIFRVFQRVFQSDSRVHKELASFARFVFRGFAEVASRNPKAYMELLFWKSTKQATEMVDGYDAEPHAKKSKSAWSEEEEDELRTLFMEHQTNKPSQDVVDYILSNLISQDRTRRGVMKKLKEMYLIVNSKSVRSEVSKRLPKEWSEEEVAQLTELWEQVREEDDPVGLIYDSLRIKRSKPKIKEKLLELNLAEDAKQLRKKRTKKSSGPKSSWENASASEDEDGSGSDEDEDDDGGVSGSDAGKKKKKKEKSRKERKKSKQPAIVYTDAQLSGLLKDVIANNLQEALQWLKESLEESLEDRDEESHEGLALVPLTAETSAAMDSPNFQRFLRGVGIEPPDLEEAYWRIPASMLVTTVKKRIEIIDKALKGEFVEEVVVASRRRDESESDEDDDDFFERLKKYSKRNDDDAESAPLTSQKSASSKSAVRKVHENPESPKSDKENHGTENEILLNGNAKRSDSEKEEDKTSPTTKSPDEERKSKPKRIKTVLDLSDSEDERQPSQEENNDDAIRTDSSQDKTNKSKRVLESDSEEERMETESQSQTDVRSKIEPKEGSAKSSRIRKVLDSDSEEEAEKLPQDADESSLEAKRTRSENSDSETPMQKKRRVLDSDEEDDFVKKAEKPVEKKQSRVLSDDEE
ncbi:hypothetical protein TSAR_004656 [Trichomalopsis sarcophagae]|uniref:Timeless C-terminal domain-containing protein n=1 Tax=Trichomalopsis sarcophagae TaxID=543379 RepID=A0A232F7Y9_9HYME|nr:hypothetical protein TSAR_004656 [Trichomalopsis sarcophagae]